MAGVSSTSSKWLVFHTPARLAAGLEHGSVPQMLRPENWFPRVVKLQTTSALIVKVQNIRLTQNNIKRTAHTQGFTVTDRGDGSVVKSLTPE